MTEQQNTPTLRTAKAPMGLPSILEGDRFICQAAEEDADRLVRAVNAYEGNNILGSPGPGGHDGRP